MIPWWVASRTQKNKWRRSSSLVSHLNNCQRLAASKARWDVILNERWLDWVNDSPFCPNVTYSILLRDPVARVESMASFLAANGWRAETGTDLGNYVTWALAVGKHGVQVASSDSYKATARDLSVAMGVMEGFDYFIDVQSSSACASQLFRLLGIKEMGWRNKKRLATKRPIGKLPKPSHDSKLLKHAYTLSDLDCDWILSMPR